MRAAGGAILVAAVLWFGFSSPALVGASIRLPVLSSSGQAHGFHTPLTGEVPTPKQAAQLRHILAGPDFHPQMSPLDVVFGWLSGLLSGIFIWLSSQSAGQGGPLALIGLLLVLVAGLVVLIIGRAVNERLSRGGRLEESRGRQLTARAAAARAQDMAARGMHREALQSLFVSVLLGLSEAGALNLQPGLTNREYLSSVQRSVESGEVFRLPHGGLSALEQLVNRFDSVWYGGRAIDASGYERCLQLAKTVAETVAGQRAA